MKNTKNTLLKWLLGTCLFLAGVQEAFACAGTAYIRVPSTWKDVNIYYGNESTKIPSTAYDATSDYYIVDLSSLKGNMDTYFAVYTTNPNYTNIDHPGLWGISDKVYDGVVAGRPGGANGGLKCPGSDGVVYIMNNPLKPGTTYTGSVPSGAKYFHVLVPNYVEWQADQLMIRYDTKTGAFRDTVMTPDQELCGWVSMVFEEAPNNVYLYRKNSPTEQLGKGGLTAFDNGEAAEPIELSAYYDGFGTDHLYFAPDEDDWVDENDGGWYIIDPGVPEAGDRTRCSFSLAALIYDTDESVNPLFSSNGNPDFYGAAKDYTSGCVGVHKGIVMEDLDPVTKKPVFSGSKNAVKCFGNAQNFNTLFNYTVGKNEVKCYDMPFRHYGTDTRWGYDSDSTKVYSEVAGDTLVGGFSPFDENPNAEVVTINGVTMGPLLAARTKRIAAGPVPVIDSMFPMKNGTKMINDFDHYCNTPGWFDGVDCEYKFDNGDNPAGLWCWGNYCNAEFFRWNGEDNPDIKESVGEKRNQQFCFESHATFTYNEDQEFTFRGDDDIWVFINNKIAVDNGGAHLAAPAHVVLKNLNVTYGAGFLVPGKEYPLDIFFCDRRTTMSNVIIKTNMYIVQKTAITATKKRDPKDKTVDLYEMCYTESGDGSCTAALTGQDEALTCCGNDFVTNPLCTGFSMDYYLIPGSDLKYEGDKKKHLESGKVSYGGIDLTNPASPVINKKKISLPEPGRWTLFVVVNGASKKVASFRMAGEVDVVSGDAIAYYYDDDDKVISSMTKEYSFTKSAMAGPATPSMSDLVPVYVSAVAGDENGKVVIQPGDADNISYKLEFSAGMRAFKMIDGGMTEIFTNTTQLKVSGVDTIYVYVPQMMMTASTQNFTIKVEGKATGATIQFYLPQLAFVDTLYKDASDQWVIDPASLKILTGDTADAKTGKVEERLTGYAYDFFLVALKPVDGGGYEPCLTCSLDFTLNGSSIGVAEMDPTKLRIENGGAAFQVRSLKQYLLADANPAVVHVEGEIPLVAASYTPIYFADPPCPIPSFADVFDVVGATPAVPLNIPAPYFSQTTEYQDGIADMVDIYYNRMIPKDSLPLAVCIEWETSTAEKYYPAKEGWSTKDGDDDYVLCNAVVVPSLADNATNCDQNMKNIDGDIVIDSTTGQPVVYCDQRIRFTGLTLSSSVKTMGPGKVTSFSLFKDRKGNIVKQGFESETMIDRIAPMALSASVITRKDSKGKETDQDVMTITMSEPVKIVEGIDRFKVFDFYITNGNLKDEERFASATENTSLIVTSQIEPTIDSSVITVNYINPTDEATGLKKLVTPYKDDYFRLSGSIEPVNVFWSDKTDITLSGADSIRAIVKAKNLDDSFLDEQYYWNSPSGYAETKRLPSPWIEITGSAQSGITPNKFAYTSYASDTAKSPIVVHSYNKYRTFQQVVDKEGGIPGHFVMADMLSYYNLLSTEDRKKLANDLDKVYFYYKVEYFTNLGNYVAGATGKIFCKDETNEKKYGRSFFGKSGENKTCIDAGSNRNWYIGWNMLSDEGRQVGTGVYITKIEAYVKLGGKKDGRKEETFTMGVKKATKGGKIYNTEGRTVFQEEF
ncbi:MAG: fibro-slime domain-containing protein [Fibrobacter sp.]|nr:fibro-slime domain-containing protein [Fibrobacter sp.]